MAAGLPQRASLVSRFHITTLGAQEGTVHTTQPLLGHAKLGCQPAIIQPTQCCKEAVTGREGQCLHFDLMQHKAAVQLFRVKFPHNHISLQGPQHTNRDGVQQSPQARTHARTQCSQVHLEPRVSTLSGGEVGAAGGTGKAGNVVGVSLQEGLMLWAGQVPYNNGSAERVDEMAAVRMHHHTSMNAACTAHTQARYGLSSLTTSTLPPRQPHVPSNPMLFSNSNSPTCAMFYNEVVMTTMAGNAEKSN